MANYEKYNAKVQKNLDKMQQRERENQRRLLHQAAATTSSQRTHQSRQRPPSLRHQAARADARPQARQDMVRYIVPTPVRQRARPSDSRPTRGRPEQNGSNRDRPKREKRSLLDNGLLIAATSGTLIFGAGVVVKNMFPNWLDSGDKKRSIEIPAPTAKIGRYAALISGTATSDFPVDGERNIDHIGPFDCGVHVHDEYHAVATIANKIGSFTVSVTPDQSQVTIDVNSQPDMTSGFEMNKSSTNAGDNGFFDACELTDIIKLETNMQKVAQASADTIGDCIVARPDFQAAFKEQMIAFGKTAGNPNANVVVNMPPVPDVSASRTALDVLKDKLSKDGIKVDSTYVDNCTFNSFTIVPIHYNERTGQTS